MFSTILRALKRRKANASISYGRLSKSEKLQRAALIFAGKMVGLFIVLVAMGFLPVILGGNAVHAQDKFTDHETTLINTANTIWTLVAAFLVFGMQAGFTFLEAGFARQRESVNILMECVFDTCICGILFWAVGYAFMFGQGNGFVGWGGGPLAGGESKSWFFLMNIPDTYGATGVPILAHWIFQFAFADTTSTITSGAMIGRTSFRGDILYSIGVTGFIYPIVGHWAWGPDGFLATMGTQGHFLESLGTGFRDFAGSTVVHTIGGMISLAGALVLGPRLGRVFKRDGGGMPAAHNLNIAVVGGFILWFGWYGFNPGSTLSAVDMQGIGRVAANTTLAACAGGISAMYIALWFSGTKKFDVGYTTNGFLAGLVAITCPCYWVSPFGAIMIGVIAGIIVYFAINLLEWLRIDDPIGAVPVHGFCGIWGTLSLGLFACGKYGITGPTGSDNSAPVTGLFYGGGATILEGQIVGSLIITLASLVLGLILMLIVNKLPYPWKLRVEPEGETNPGGLDMFEHGVEAYVMN